MGKETKAKDKDNEVKNKTKSPKNKKTTKKNSNTDKAMSKLSSKSTSPKDEQPKKKRSFIKKFFVEKEEDNQTEETHAKDGKFRVDILDILIIVVVTSIISCVLTGFILNYQYKHSALNKQLNTDENISEFLNTYSEIANNYYEEVDKKGMIDAAIAGMLDYLEDNYSIYLDKDETDALSGVLDSTYEGIGITSVDNIVARVFDDSPAAEAGLKVNDEIVKVNGTAINKDNFELISDLIANNKNDTNEIVVKRNNKELTFNVERSKVTIPVTSTELIKMNGKNIGYLSLSAFSEKSFEEFQDCLLKLEQEKKIDSLIIDLRNNSGGYLNSANDIASLFIEEGKVIYSLESKGEVTTHKDETKDKRTYPIVILVNSGTASAAEILTSALKDSYNATIVGNTTYGKGKVQTTLRFDDRIMKYTSAKWLRPNGDCIDEIGINPDYQIDIEYKNNTIYDKQLDKAIEVLSK